MAGKLLQENALRRQGGASGSASSSNGVPPRRKLPGGGRNSMSKLMRREIGGLSSRPPPRPDVTFCAEKFWRFKLREEFGVYDDTADVSSIVEKSIVRITAANDFIFVIDCHGFCVAFRQAADGSIAQHERDGEICHFNHANERIESLFYNKMKDSIIIFSSMSTSDGLHIRATPLESIRRCDNWDGGVPLFGPDKKKCVFLDDCNNVALVTSLHIEPEVTALPTIICVNNVYDMSSYKLVHSISGENIMSTTSRPGILIVAYDLVGCQLPIEVFSTENWRVLKRINYSLATYNVLQIIEVYKDNILLKEMGKDMRIIDIWNHNKVNVLKQTKDRKLIMNFELYANRLLLRFNNDIVVASNSRGEKVSLLEDDEAVGANCGHFPFDTHATNDKNYAICYARKSIEKPIHAYIGSINICNTFNGESIWKINPCDDVDLTIAKRNDAANNMANVHCSISEALENVTAIFYDEEHHRIYTGNRRGFIHVWSN